MVQWARGTAGWLHMQQQEPGRLEGLRTCRSVGSALLSPPGMGGVEAAGPSPPGGTPESNELSKM